MRRLLVLALLVLVPAEAAQALEAQVTRTRYGVPHVTARSWRGVGYGFAYAFAQDDLCTIAEQYVTVAGERSRYFGPDGSWRFRGNGSVNNNLDSDFFYGKINAQRVVERLASQPAPAGPDARVRALVAGYVAGYNRYLADTGIDRLPDPRCRGAAWVRPITALDVYRRFYQLASLASSGVAIDGIGGAAPSLSPAAAARARAAQASALARDLGRLRIDSGSNAYAFGADATDNGMGMVLGNPHFPWKGSERLYQAQLRIPGRLDVSGATLYGVPLVLIGHTRGLAWSHTVATAWRFTPFALTLSPADPHTYLVDGRPEAMRPTTVTVKVRTGDGTLADRTRTLYDTRYGPVFTSLLGIGLFPWTPTSAYALGDVNAANFRYLNHFVETDLAQSVAAYDAIERRYQGVPWVNSIAADRAGNAYYTMNGAIPNVPDAKARACDTPLGAGTFAALGLPVLDGSRSACGWDSDPDAAAPGIFGNSEVPTLRRRDYVFNGNDSHWLTNARVRLEGYARSIGDERTTRRWRTRLGLLQVEQRLAGTDGRPGRRMTLADLQDITLQNRQYGGELWRDALVGMCRAQGRGDACDVLARWDLHSNLGSRGVLLFRRFVERLPVDGLPAMATVDTGEAAGLYTVPFDPSDPLDTPRGLNTANPLVQQALPGAIDDLRGAGIPLDAGLRGWQWTERGGRRVDIHGGPDGDGNFNAINVPWDPRRGYPDVPSGSSYIMAAQFVRGRRCPVVERTFVTYSQSENPASRHSGDYTRAFSAKRWNPEPFCARDVARAARTVTALRSGRPAVVRQVRRRANPARPR